MSTGAKRLESFPDSFYNQPKFCSYPSWNPIATTFANQSTSGREIDGIFIDSINTIYIAAKSLNQIQIIRQSSITKNISIASPISIFATRPDHIYISTVEHQIVVWHENGVDNLTLTQPPSACWDLFVDRNGSIYCSLHNPHQVVKYMADQTSPTHFTVIAGNNTNGTGPDMLHTPRGIFVNSRFQLFVADCGNNRIQRFDDQNRTGQTVAGAGAENTIALLCPMDVMLDADGYLFIVDHGHHRIVGSGPQGFRCLVGCTGAAGAAAYQLNLPRSFSFDQQGNLYVTEANNSRVQQFSLATNSCSKWNFLRVRKKR